ncbi:MAG TPA: response regulator transcription factor [Rhodanobacteraceae bacterium]|nr:response regulator transcription factor [Rhodanobacteraceae bacterium]
MACHFETSPRGHERAFPEPEAAPKVYVVGDDAASRERLVFWLSRADFRAAGFADAASFQQAFAASRCDLVVVDTERERGLALACLLREHPGIGVVVLSAYADVGARVRSFESGADAHLSKPIDPRELTAQLRALHRRLVGAKRPPAATGSGAWLLKQDGWVIEDPHGAAMHLTTAERAFVACLIASRGAPASRDELLESLGDNPRDADPHRIDVLVNRLRRKAASLGMTLPLHAVRGRGYVLANGTGAMPVAHELARIAASADAAPGVVRPLFQRDAR